MKTPLSIILNPTLAHDSVLGKIVLQKFESLTPELRSTSDLNTISLPEKSDRSLFEVLSQPGGHFICEFKQASPTLGSIREGDRIEDVVKEYAPFASAISVLTEKTHFKGDLNFIPLARQFCQHPILCKDFILFPKQVVQAREYGADVVLLMLSVLQDDAYRACAAMAERLGVDVLTEVHSEDELTRALDLGAKIIGINNRDLSDLSIDLASTEKLVKRIPADKRKHLRIISESGIRSRADVVRLAPLVDGFLVGSSLMAETRIDLKLRDLVFGQTKICGLSNSVDADLAYMAGARFGGMILAQGSKRTLTPQRAAAIAKRTPLPLVAVFKDQTIDEVVETAQLASLHAVQLHGSENDDYLETLREKLPASVEIWKTLHVTDHLPKPPAVPVNALLFENGNSKLSGGSGESFDWSLLESVADTYKGYSSDQLILAGGLNSDNIAQAMQTPIQRFDLASGVESRPGFKDEKKIQQLFAAIKQQTFKV
ncbi:MAG: bifunctional indole-3-glycerol-phosphate synthase TrpC/phosphoribosylanthranilate isomerase TrpF [Gammaproteobacteria bacterium]|nr:bifunctional indole-3-glycerol-phosphate synthase TrpC/phosphoribosylanthranilate isomerase TrpF [Gammaproteobacteria bacterium]